jgi:Domain of unknown function (DUF4919)
MRRLLLGVALALALGQAAVADPASEARYQTLLAAAKADAGQVDWTALRQAYAASDAFDVTGDKTKDARKTMFDALAASDMKTAAAQAQAILVVDYVDIDAHVVLDLAAEGAGDTIAAQREHAIVVGLLKSIRTGDGLTPEHAFTPITIDEAYAMLRALARQPTGQAFVRTNGHSYDRITVVGPDGKPVTLYFLVDGILAKAAPPPPPPHN